MYKSRSTRNMRNCLRLFEEKEGRQFIIFDTETTGLKPDKDRIIELSAIKYRIFNRDMKEIDRLDVFIKPPFEMDSKPIEIHGITNEFLSDKPSEEDVFDGIYSFFSDTVIFAGHNIDFDINMLKAMYERNNKEFQYIAALDTLEMARDFDSENYKLQTVAKEYGIDTGIQFHCSIDDVIVTSRLLSVLYSEYSEMREKLNKTNKERLYVNYIYYWKGFNKYQSGIYIDTNLGRIYLSSFQKCWCSKDVDLDNVDIDDLEQNVTTRTGLSIINLSKMTENKFAKLKESGRV